MKQSSAIAACGRGPRKLSNAVSNTPNSGRLPSLDGLRAVSISLVLGSHSVHAQGFPAEWEGCFRWLFDGALGVRCFFTISGFLITYLMLLEVQRSGRGSLRNFYLRRTLRILPVYFLFLLALGGLQMATPFSLTSAQWISSLTFTVNFFPGVWSNGHLWSLAVEEQFYLIWPFLFVLAGLAGQMRRATLLLLVPLVSAPVFRVIGYTGWAGPELRWLFNSASFLMHMDGLAMGCLAAFLFHGERLRIEQLIGAWPKAVCLTALGLIGLPYVLSRLFLGGIFTVPLGPTTQSLGFTLLLLLGIVRPTWGGYRLLNWAPICQVGVLSYSLYLWQQIFCSPPQDFGVDAVWWMSFPGWLFAAFAAAAVSYYAFELPLVQLRARYR